MSHTFHQLRYHLVFSTKDRQALIQESWEARLHAYFGTVLESKGAGLIAVGGIEDHIYLLMWAKPVHAPAELVNTLKANSSRWISETFGAREFAWQTGYGLFTVSHSVTPSVVEYIRGQREHHRRFTFQEEFREMLRRHEMTWVEEYVWG
ncbi:MAG: IS200/IS605 family transposase [Phycisphaerales bacterium]